VSLPGSCTLDTIQQEMERLPQGLRRLAVQLRLALHPDWLWTVLTDYDRLDAFIPNLARSRQIWRRGDKVAVEQVGSQQFCGLRFSKGTSAASRGPGGWAPTTPVPGSSTSSRCRGAPACPSV